MYRIELQFGDPASGRASTVSLSGPDAECVLGRSPACNVTIDDTMAADRHCRLFVAGGRLMVENLDEEIGTCLNGEFVSDPMPVDDGAELLVGTTVLRVCVHALDEAASVTTEPPCPMSAPPVSAAPVEPEPDAGNSSAPTREEASAVVHPFEQESSGRTQERMGGQATPVAEPIAPASRPLPPFQPPGPAANDAAERSSSTRTAGGAARSWAHAMTYSADSDLVSRIEADLVHEFADRVGDKTALRALIQRGIERAQSYGLEEDDHVFQFIRCMVMLDDEIDGRNPDTEDVWLTLNHARRPAAQRIERALKIASRIAAERSGSRSRAGLSNRPHLQPPPSPPPGPSLPVSAAPLPKSPGVPPRAEDETAAGEVSQATHATRGTPPPPPDTPMDEELPHIEGFLIKEEIGAGGMGRVFLAYDNQLDKDVAIKVLRTVDPEAQEQLQHEARAAARLEHPNIVQVSRFEKLGRGGFYVMQFVRGLDGSKLVRKFESVAAHQLPGEAVLRAAGVDAKRSPAELRELLVPDKNAYYRLVAYWIAGVADGLERAHSEGVLHRDIKPSNLLLSADGRMMLTDFGLAARPADRQGIGRARVGTPRYLSPERVADWASFSDEVQHQDARADIWSLGAVLYEFLTYRPAYRGSVPEVLRAIVTEPPLEPGAVVWSVPEPLQRICLMAMARRPDDRFRRCSDFAESLRGWIRVDTGAEKKGRIPFLS